ncbi:MAG TPA: glycosyltransferase family 87 protein [Anaerolineae bacterium]|nr:glycosyltransferase family 87 protein [Anaerolineae bacterium]HQI85458.1 glycosyltransferase family 87 protein [Anaerolineae bacterium]
MVSRTVLPSFTAKYLLPLKRYGYITAPVGLGLFLHLGTAILRLKTFFPYPKLLDFSAFYAAALALRSGFSPYSYPADWLQHIRVIKAIPFLPPPIYNPPFWPWLLQPLTLVDFPTAAWLWLGLNLTLLVWGASMLARLAGYQGKKVLAAAFILTVTFGPVFLDLTLGQTSVVLLAAALGIGVSLRQTTKSSLWSASLAEGLATGAKLFPVLWMGAAVFLRRWKFFVLGMLAVSILLGITALWMPEANKEYWFNFLPYRIMSASEQPGMDDQSLGAWLDRLGRSHTYNVPGLDVNTPVTITWSPPWSVNPELLRWGGYVLAGILALPVMIRLLRTPSAQAEAGFYLWVLYTLIIFPHIERYNHTLLLPALAWLWGQGKWQKTAAALAYLLAGLSRLNHMWITTLPAPWAPLASGFGLYAAVVLAGSLYVSLKPAFAAT